MRKVGAALALLAAMGAAHAQPATPHERLAFDIYKELVEINVAHIDVVEAKPEDWSVLYRLVKVLAGGK